MSVKMKKRLRIFVTTSHISTVYMTLYAGATKTGEDADVLLLDSGTRRQILIDLVGETSQVHSWALYHCFSTAVTEAHDFRPPLRKRLTRQWKGLPVIRNAYNALHTRYLKKLDTKYKSLLRELLEPFKDYANIELFVMTQTYLNGPLKQLYPDAQVHFLEHGIGDYFYVLEKNEPGKKFDAVFADPFRRYLANKQQPVDWISPLAGRDGFNSLSRQLLKKHTGLLRLDTISKLTKPCIFILLEAVDMYEVPESFWTAYIDHILAQVDVPSDFHYLLKTHPIQSQVSIEKTEAHFRKLGFSYTLLADDRMSSASAEVLFEIWADQTRHVFCLFSSGCFYLSQLYRDRDIQFWYSTEFMSRFIGNAPPQYKIHFEGLRPLIEQVFAERCKPY